MEAKRKQLIADGVIKPEDVDNYEEEEQETKKQSTMIRNKKDKKKN